MLLTLNSNWSRNNSSRVSNSLSSAILDIEVEREVEEDDFVDQGPGDVENQRKIEEEEVGLCDAVHDGEGVEHDEGDLRPEELPRDGVNISVFLGDLEGRLSFEDSVDSGTHVDRKREHEQ